MIHLSGLQIKDEHHPAGEIEISYTGLRPGEKLYEELLIGDNVTDTCHSRIMRAEEQVIPWNTLEKMLSDLESASRNDDFIRAREILTQVVTGFVPQCGIDDLVWKQDRSQV